MMCLNNILASSRRFTSLAALAVVLLALSGCRAPDAPVTLTPPEQRLLLLDMARAGKRLIAVGEAGSILVSEDAGAHWQHTNSPAHALLTAVYFVDAQHGWAVGHDMLILATTDGGLHWKQQFAAPQENRPLLDVWFADANRGYAVGAYGALLVTRDGGATWQARHQTADDHHLYAILGLPDGPLLAAGEAGTLRRSNDGGNTWQALTTPYSGSFFGLLRAKDGGLLLYGLRGHLMRSADNGTHWQEITSPTNASLMGGSVLEDDRIVLAGAAGTVIESRDNGRTFKALSGGGHHAWVTALGVNHRLLLAGEAGIGNIEE